MQTSLFDSTKNQLLKAKTYLKFKESLAKSNCTKCELSQNRTHIVIDRGNPEAKVIMIGEAPGENEDLQGKAFVGRSGKLLDEVAKSVGFDTNQDSLIINIVKCRPPENRRPTADEASSCIPFLKKQIELVKPKLIILLGATALKHVISDKKEFSMSKEVGNLFEHADYPGIKLMVLYHPAYILRDPRKKPLMTEHLKRLTEFWKKIN